MFGATVEYARRYIKEDETDVNRRNEGKKRAEQCTPYSEPLYGQFRVLC